MSELANDLYTGARRGDQAQCTRARVRERRAIDGVREPSRVAERLGSPTTVNRGSCLVQRLVAGDYGSIHRPRSLPPGLTSAVSPLTQTCPGRRARRSRGFSLIEIAVAMAIIALLIGTLLVPLTAQVAQRKASDTRKTLEEIRETLIGYAIRNSRLPCPATATSNGIESFVGAVGSSACADPYTGFVPAVTLGFSAIDGQGYAIDAWGTRIRYAVTTANANAFTSVRGMQSLGMDSLTPDLHVCASSTGIDTTTCGGAPVLANGAPAVIYSAGPNWATGGSGADEAANLANTPVFVSHVPSDTGASGGKFDDIVNWLSAYTLYSRMVSAGQLP